MFSAHPGLCPSNSGGNCTGTSGDTCSNDSNCGALEKCCSTNCGLACVGGKYCFMPFAHRIMV